MSSGNDSTPGGTIGPTNELGAPLASGPGGWAIVDCRLPCTILSPAIGSMPCCDIICAWSSGLHVAEVDPLLDLALVAGGAGLRRVVGARRAAVAARAGWPGCVIGLTLPGACVGGPGAVRSCPASSACRCCSCPGGAGRAAWQP